MEKTKRYRKALNEDTFHGLNTMGSLAKHLKKKLFKKWSEKNRINNVIKHPFLWKCPMFEF